MLEFAMVFLAQNLPAIFRLEKNELIIRLVIDRMFNVVVHVPFQYPYEID